MIHIPVLLDKVMELMQPIEGKTVLDGTLGLGGHAEALLERMGGSGQYIGLDQDEHALEMAKERLAKYQTKITFVQTNFSSLREIIDRNQLQSVDRILLDLGVSNLQLEDEQRGFSFKVDGPLDMRMDGRQRMSAKDIVNNLDEKDLGGLLREYGEERFAWRIAAAIVRERKRNPITTTRQLAQIVERAVPRKAWPRHIHPATRTFQALRIVVNDELGNLKQGLEQAIDSLSPEGRLIVISYHSLEDRIVKNRFKALDKAQWKTLTKKPIVPEELEVKENRKSRSAKLRAIERAA